MAQKIQLRRGLETNRGLVTPDAGEVLVTTDNLELFIGDGATAGGGEIGYLNTRTGGTVASLVVTGDLTVNGTTTTVNSNIVDIGDNIIRLNADLPNDTAPSEDGGFEVYRGTGTGAENAVSFIWNELDNKWQVTEDGVTWYDVLHENDLDNTTGGTNGLVAPITSGSVFAALALKQDNLTFGISNTNSVVVDGAVNAPLVGDLAVFTASGIEGKTTAELDIVHTTDTNASTWSWIDTDGTMASATDNVVPTQLAVTTYVAQEIGAVTAGAMNYKGEYNAATNTPDLDVTPSGVVTGDTYTVSAAGTFFSTPVEVGDVLIAEIDNATLETNWTIVNRNVDAASTSTAGIVELATTAETDAGADTVRAVTPASLANILSDVATNTAKVSNVTTNLSIGTTTATTLDINSSDGTNATIPAAIATTAAGLLTGADKSKLDGIADGATANVGTVTSVASGNGLTGGPITSTGTLTVQAADASIDVAVGGISVATVDGGTF